MKHNFLFKVCLGILGMLFWGCSDLDIQNPNAITEDTFWQDADDAFAGVVATYDRVRPDTWGLRTQMSIRLNRSDEVIGDREEEVEYSKYINFDGGAIWNWAYQGINRANQVLTNVPDIEMDESLKNRLLSEARFLRAYWYFDLVTYFGDLPLMLELPDEESEFFPAQAPASEVYDAIIADLTTAIPNLPDVVGDNDYGRASAAAAQALLGKVQLFREQYESAETAFQATINIVGQPLVALQPDFSNNFGDLNPEPNPEFLFMIRNDDTQSDENTWRAKYFAPFAAQGWRLSLANPWLLTEMQKELTSSGDYDPRLLTTLHWDDPASTAYGLPFAESSDDPTHVYLKKLMRHNVPGGEGGENSGVDFPLIRYADVLLMQAEVKNELGKSAEAVALINQIRERAGLADFSSGDQQEIFDEIVHQRIMELAGEGHRFLDLKRWGMLSLIKEHDPDPATIGISLPRDEVLAIPQSEIDTNPNVTQNPGF